MEFVKVYEHDDMIYVENNNIKYRICFPVNFEFDQGPIFKKVGCNEYIEGELVYYEFDITNKKSIKMIDQMLSLDDDPQNSLENKFKYNIPKLPTKQVESEEDFINGSLKEKVSSLKIDNNEVDTSVPMGEYPREIYKDLTRGILVNDYSVPSFCLFFKDWRFENEWFQTHYQCRSTDIFGEKKNYKISNKNEFREKGFCIAKSTAAQPINKSSKITKLEVIMALTGVNPLELCTKTTTTFTAKTNYRPKGEDNLVQDANLGTMTSFKFVTEPVANSLLGTFPQREKFSDIFDKFIKEAEYGTGDIREEYLSDYGGTKRMLMYGKINIVDNKFMKLDQDKILKQSETIIESTTSDPDDRTKIISYMIID